MSVTVTHRCHRRHRTHQTLAECCWPGAAWISGDGPYAVLAHCDMLSVTLHDTPEAARSSLARLGELPCCRSCDGRHELVTLSLEDQSGPDETSSARGSA